MNKMIRSIICIMTLASLMVPAAALAESAEQAYQKARDAYYSLQNSSRKQMYREKLGAVFDQFESVAKRFPETRRGAGRPVHVRQDHCTGLYRDQSHQTRCRTRCRTFRRDGRHIPRQFPVRRCSFPRRRNARRNLGDKQRAYLVFQRLVSALPRGDMRTKASSRLKVPCWICAAPKQEPAEEDRCEKRCLACNG